MALEMDCPTIVSKAKDGSLDWCVPVSELILVAEWTTSHGPWAHDWFIVFVSIEDGKPSFAVCPAAGSEPILEYLSQQFGVVISVGLLKSTDWDSNIIWPPSLAGQKYYTFKPVESGSIAQRVWAKFWRQREYTVSSVVWSYIDRMVLNRAEPPPRS